MDGDAIIDMPSDDTPQRRLNPLKHDETSTTHRGITALTVDTPSATRFNLADSPRPKARWKTSEFIFYAIIFVLVVPWMAWTPYTLSRREPSLLWTNCSDLIVGLFSLASQL